MKLLLMAQQYITSFNSITAHRSRQARKSPNRIASADASAMLAVNVYFWRSIAGSVNNITIPNRNQMKQNQIKMSKRNKNNNKMKEYRVTMIQQPVWSSALAICMVVHLPLANQIAFWLCKSRLFSGFCKCVWCLFFFFVSSNILFCAYMRSPPCIESVCICLTHCARKQENFLFSNRLSLSYGSFLAFALPFAFHLNTHTHSLLS